MKEDVLNMITKIIKRLFEEGTPRQMEIVINLWGGMFPPKMKCNILGVQ